MQQNYFFPSLQKIVKSLIDILTFSFDTIQWQKIEHTLNDIYHVQSTFNEHSSIYVVYSLIIMKVTRK